MMTRGDDDDDRKLMIVFVDRCGDLPYLAVHPGLWFTEM